jgi:hypothetical protein
VDALHSRSGRVYKYKAATTRAMRYSGNVAKSRQVILKLVSNCFQTAESRGH